MRIVAGQHRSRVLESPKGDAIRPTSDKVRGALFNMLNSRGAVIDAVVLDVFCGTGALGLEALSQGAQFCTFIDKNKSSLDLAKRNIAALKEEGRSRTLLADSTKLPSCPPDVTPATLVFLDPPYEREMLAPSITSLDSHGWLSRNALLVVESAASENGWMSQLAGYAVLQERLYGDTAIRLLQKKSD